MLRTIAAAAVLLGSATPAVAQSPFDGKWKVDLGAARFDPKPDVLMLRDGVYSCRSCVPAYSVPADGQFHAIPGHPYVDAIAITVDGPRSYRERDRKNGKVTGESTTTVSADGRTLATHFVDSSAANGKVVTGDQIETRVGAAPAGSHATSGSWRQTTVSGVPDSGLTFTIRADATTFHYAAGTGEHADGRFGTFVPLIGDAGGTKIRYDRIDARTLRATSRRGGRTVSIATITVSPDGRTLTNTSHDLLHGTTFTGKAAKQ